jgi:hypothetical protein
MTDARRIPQPGEVWRHYKGHYCYVREIVEHTETGELLVVYACDNTEQIWARPLENWQGKVHAGTAYVAPGKVEDLYLPRF